MIFTEFRFLRFFAAIFCIYWSLPWWSWRKLLLLVASYAFYSAWDWRFCSLILISTAIDFVVGRALSRTDRPGRRRLLLLVSLCGNLGILSFFKYFNFFVDSAVDLLGMLGLPASVNTLHIILPVGISFYTFQSLSYTIDIYRGNIEPTNKFLDFALFVAFFPQLVAGPIVRASSFLPQLREPPRFANVQLRACLILFLMGYFKKSCVADGFAPIVDTFFSDPGRYDVLATWMALWLFAVQIYCDFSGYSDMAIASAGLLGYQLRINFAHPYFAHHIEDFWHCWHISLSTWLRDYLYIPLGGNRGSSWQTRRNLMATMVLGGLWHGAAWRFIIWGLLHGVALVGHKLLRERWPVRRIDSPPHPLMRFAAVLLTFYWVCLAWIFFRATDMSDAITISRAYLLFDAAGTESLNTYILPVLAGLALMHWITYCQDLTGWWQRLPDWGFAATYGVAVSVTLLLTPTEPIPFIYFQF